MPPRTPRSSTSQQPDDFIRWSAQAERSKAVDNYTAILKDADLRSVTQVENFAKRVEKVYKTMQIVYIVTLVAVGLISLISTILLLLKDSKTFFGAIGLPASLIIVLILIYRNPLKSARQVMGEVVKTQIIYLGYLRQVNQIDIGFKQNFVSSEKINPKQFQDTFVKTQEIIDKAIDDINLLMDDLT